MLNGFFNHAQNVNFGRVVGNAWIVMIFIVLNVFLMFMQEETEQVIAIRCYLITRSKWNDIV